MGNKLCSCTGRHNSKDKRSNLEFNHQNNITVDIINKPQSATPYENEPFRYKLNSETTEISNNNDISLESYPITPQFQSQTCSIPDSNCTRVTKRPSLSYTSPSKGHDSVFASENENQTNESQDIHYYSEIYELILKEFFLDNYPINNDIITEMKRRNLLTQNDAITILSLNDNESKSKLFLSKFIFSETNLCKLATFLFVLINEKSVVFYNLQKNEKILHSIVDHIYYVVNFISLLLNCFPDDHSIKLSLIQSLITINYNKNTSEIKKINERKSINSSFYIRIHLDNKIFPSHFWSFFAQINEDFLCCQELIISSCNLMPEDIYNLIQGLRSVNVLRLLDVSTNPITDVGLKHIQSLFQIKNYIETINLTCCSLTHVGVEEFLDILAQNTLKFHLRNLSLSHNDLENLSENSVLIFTKLPLMKLELQSTNIKCQKSLFESLKLNYSLKSLDISRNKFINKDLQFLASGLAYNNNLKTISLAMVGLLKNDCGTINNTFLMNKSLVSIDLSDNPIGDEGVEILKDIFIMKKCLREVFMKRCNISLQGILTLLRHVSEPDCHLNMLDLCYNRCPRMSIALDSKYLSRKIYDILHHIGLVKDLKIILWGTIDLPVPYFETNDYLKVT